MSRRWKVTADVLVEIDAQRKVVDRLQRDLDERRAIARRAEALLTEAVQQLDAEARHLHRMQDAYEQERRSNTVLAVAAEERAKAIR